MISESDRDRFPVSPTADSRTPVEIYSAKRKAEFLLANAVDEEDYAWAEREVRKLRIDPAAVPHGRPTAE